MQCCRSRCTVTTFLQVTNSSQCLLSRLGEPFINTIYSVIFQPVDSPDAPDIVYYTDNTDGPYVNDGRETAGTQHIFNTQPNGISHIGITENYPPMADVTYFFQIYPSASSDPDPASVLSFTVHFGDLPPGMPV